MWPVIEQLLEGLDLKIRALKGRISACPRRVFLEDLKIYSTDSAHLLWHITDQKSGDTFALDLTSAQFGHYQPLTPWKTYLERIKFDVKNSFIPGHWTKCSSLYSDDITGHAMTRLMEVHREGILDMVKFGGPDEKKFKTADILPLPQKKFEELRQQHLWLCNEVVWSNIDDACKVGLLVKRHGTYLLAEHPLTLQGVHPYKQVCTDDQHEARLTNIRTTKLRARTEEEKAPLEMSFEQEKYEDLTYEQKLAVDKHMKGQSRTSNSRFTLVQGIFWHTTSDQKVFIV